MEWGASLHAVIGRPGDIAWWQMSIRGVLVLVYALAVVRLWGRRVFGRPALLDVVVAIVVGSTLSRTITANAPLLPTLAATAAIFVVHALLVYAALHVRWLRWFVQGRTVQLVANGRVDWHAMHLHGLGEEDLDAALRGSGLRSREQVAEAFLERNGRISILTRG